MLAARSVRSALLCTLMVPLSGVGCGSSTTEEDVTQYPKLVLSDSVLEFGSANAGETVERTFIISNEGEMPMGIGSITFGDGMPESYSFVYEERDTCPGADSETTADTKASDSGRGSESDPGPRGDSDPGDDSGPGTEDTLVGAIFTVDPGCRRAVTVAFTPVTVGDIWAAIIVEAVQAEVDEDEEDLPDFLRDPIHWNQMIYLHGSSDQFQGSLVVRPRSYDFGYVNPTETTLEVARIDVTNVGDAPVTLGDATFSTTCDDAFSLISSFTTGRVLAAGETTLVEVAFTPEDTNAARCELYISSDDPANPQINVTLQGNVGFDPENRPPTVAIRSPEPGFIYPGVGDLTLELNVFDVNQPATTLTCKVKSALIVLASIANCTPDDESGHVYVDIPSDALEPGLDTLVVTVTDASQTTAQASISVLINTEVPAGDDDGDGFDESTVPADCDDTNRYTYPAAAEIFDGLDNDCDLLIDENTEGSDDDGDSVSESDGDCDDYNADSYPTAPERPDGADNDCDGVVDESTSLYDDDGDGFAEVNNDCDDSEAAINPAADELCDGLDNDCDGIRDAGDGCITTDSDPMIIGPVRPAQNACLSGEQITLDVRVFDADGQISIFSWSDDSGTGASNFDNPSAAVVNWTCPALPEDSGGQIFNVFVLVYDPDGRQDWAFTEISVYPADYVQLYEPYTEVSVDSEAACATGPTSAAWGLVGLGLVAARRRRRT